MKKYYGVNDLSSYQLAYSCSNKVWSLVTTWDYFSKTTVGNQLVRSIDSVSANIAEGFGRHGKKDKIRFYVMARASLLESEDWLNKSIDRQIVTALQIEEIKTSLSKLPLEINKLIKYTRENLKE